MPTITGQEIADQVQYLLQDADSVRWVDAELLVWLNAAQKEVAFYKPDASVTNAAVVLIAGTKQSIPAAGIHFLKLTRNMGTSGTVPGKAVRAIDQEIMDAQSPDWHSAATDAVVTHYMFDPHDPLNFYVTPPQPASGFGYVEMVYASSPTDLATLAGTITISDNFQNALVNYVMYRALSKDATYTKDGVDATQYYQAFLSSIGVLGQIQAAVNPNNAAGNPNVNPLEQRSNNG